jgi:predicted CXXCH cytochrome family protein
MLILAGCDPLTRHKTLVSVLDGYPSLPPVEELCRDYEARALQACLSQKTIAKKPAVAAQARSQHLPYLEKRCEECHPADKNSGGAGEGLLVKSREELCFICHKDMLTRKFQHGPAAVGDCLACHLPHDSENSSLLVQSKETLCAKCHTERRRAARMHDEFVAKALNCVSCHDPHSGDAPYFLR